MNFLGTVKTRYAAPAIILLIALMIAASLYLAPSFIKAAGTTDVGCGGDAYGGMNCAAGEEVRQTCGALWMAYVDNDETSFTCPGPGGFYWSGNRGGCRYDPGACTVCVPNSGCAANTCSTATCSDSCGNVYAGTQNCTPPPVTCQTHGYAYGTLGCCHRNADHSDDPCNPPVDVCPNTYGNQSSTSECNCIDNPSGPGCYVAPTDVCPATPGNQSSYSECNCVDNPSGYGCYVPTPPSCADSGMLGTPPYCYPPPPTPTCVAYTGQYCATSNSCGMSNGGAYQCDGSCSAGAPPESSCPVTPAYASLSASPGTVSSGGAATLSYSCSNSYYAELYPSVGSVSPVAGGSRTVYPTTATNYTLYCYANSGGTVTASTIVEVASPLPNLTAGSVSPTSAIAGTAFQVSATISNNGNGSTGGAFPNMFQFSDDAMISTGFMNTLEAYGSQSISANRTFSSAGSYTVRACADTNTVWAGSIAESNEGDNCGAWTTITVTAPTPPSVSCTVDNSNPTAGQTVQYTATPAAGASAPYTWNSSSGGSYGGGSTASRTFATLGTYDMQVKGSNTGYATCPFVTVGAAPCNDGGPASIDASRTRVTSGSSVTLTWSASDASAACTISGPGVAQSSTPAACSVSGSATTPAITTQATYSISCPNGVTDSVIVNVLPKIEEF